MTLTFWRHNKQFFIHFFSFNQWERIDSPIHSNSSRLTTTWYARATRQLCWSQMIKKYFAFQPKAKLCHRIFDWNAKAFRLLFSLLSLSLIFFCIRWFNGCKKGRMQISNGNARKCEYLLHRWYAFVCHSKTKATWSHYSVDSPKFVSTLARCDATHNVHFHSVQCSHTCTHGPRNTKPNETDTMGVKERE